MERKTRCVVQDAPVVALDMSSQCTRLYRPQLEVMWKHNELEGHSTVIEAKRVRFETDCD